MDSNDFTVSFIVLYMILCRGVTRIFLGNSQQVEGRNQKKYLKRENQKISQKKKGIEPDVNRTRNLLIWSQTRYHCATDPLVNLLPQNNNSRIQFYENEKKQKQVREGLKREALVFGFWTK